MYVVIDIMIGIVTIKERNLDTAAMTMFKQPRKTSTASVGKVVNQLLYNLILFVSAV